MSGLVLDADIALGWCFEDHGDGYCDSVLGALRDERGMVPAHWMLELSNVLVAAQKRQILSEADVGRFLELIRELPLDTDGETAFRAAGQTRLLARSHGLSTYEAAYLELAMRHSALLATRNSNLRAAARRCGVTLMEV